MMKPLPFLFVMLATPAFLFSQKKIYVNPKARGGMNDGSSWFNAFNSLHRALKMAGESTIFLAEGIYTPEYDSAGRTPADRRNATFIINCGVELIGGYRVIGNEVEWSKSYKTILSGDVKRNDSGTLSNPAFFHPNRNENVFRLLYFAGCGKIFRPRRFENIEFTGAHNPAGAFIGINQVSQPNDLVFSNCRFYLNVGSEALIMRGEVSATPGKLRLENCTAEQNFAGRFGWLSYVHLECRESSFISTYYYNSFFLDNPLPTGHYYRMTFLKCFFYETVLSVATLRIDGEAANELNAIDSKFFIKSTLLEYNKETDTLHDAYSNIIFTQCLVSKDNSFPSSMIRMYLRNNVHAHTDITWCTFNSYPATSLPFWSVNTIHEGHDPSRIGPVFNDFAFMHNNIFWGFPDKFMLQTKQGLAGTAYVYMEVCALQSLNGAVGFSGHPPQKDCIFSDPLFISPLGNDGLPGTPDDNLHLRFDFHQNIVSPCIDTGIPPAGLPPWLIPAYDIDGSPRIQGIADIGCYERCKCVIF